MQSQYEKRKIFIVNVIYRALVALLVYVTLKYGLGLVTPFLLAFVIAYVLRRPARFLSDFLKLPYKVVIFTLVLLFYGTIGSLVSLLGIKLFSAATNFISQVPLIYELQIEPFLMKAFKGIEQAAYRMDPALVGALNELFDQFIQSLGEIVSNLSMKAVSAVSTYASSLPGGVIKLLLMIISTFFIAGDYDILTGFVLKQFTGKGRELIIRIKQYIIGTLFVCIRSYALIMSITFVELCIGFMLIGIPNGIMVALLIAIFDVLPVLGTGGIMIPWVIIAFLQGDYSLSVGLLFVYVAVTVVRNIIEPKIVGSQIGLHPVVTLISMFVGAQLFGVLGLFGFPITLSLLWHLNDTGTIKLFK